MGHFHGRDVWLLRTTIIQWFLQIGAKLILMCFKRKKAVSSERGYCGSQGASRVQEGWRGQFHVLALAFDSSWPVFLSFGLFELLLMQVGPSKISTRWERICSKRRPRAPCKPSIGLIGLRKINDFTWTSSFHGDVQVLPRSRESSSNEKAKKFDLWRG